MDRLALNIAGVLSPQLGEVWVAVSERGLVAVEFGVPRGRFEASLRRQLGRDPQVDHGPGERVSADAACQIAEYLSSRRHTFDIPIDWSTLASDFQRTALQAVAAIPYGQTSTYGQIAAQIGYPQAPRAVGRANATNPIPLVIPCHRVIGSDGKLHGYGGTGGLKTKQWLLDMERGLASKRSSGTPALQRSLN
jgi:methylated-DNA-[protein]-cysteine S-methyltransferase